MPTDLESIKKRLENSFYRYKLLPYLIMMIVELSDTIYLDQILYLEELSIKCIFTNNLYWQAIEKLAKFLS